MERKKGFAYNHRNTALHCGNPRSFTPSKLPQVFRVRLVFLGSNRSRRTLNKRGMRMRKRLYERYKAHFGVQYWQKYLKEIAEKRKTAVISQADQRENRRFFDL